MHLGYALIDVFQPCVTFNRGNTYDRSSERVYKVEEQPGGYDPTNFAAALEKAQEWGPHSIGILYQVKHPTYEDRLSAIRERSAGRVGVHRDMAELERIKQELM